MKLDIASNPACAGGKIKLKFLLCKVSIGKAFNCSEEVACSNGIKIPEGYDSFVVDDGNEASFFFESNYSCR